MTLQPNICADPEVNKLLLEHNNRPMKALYDALNFRLKEKAGTELIMALIVDQRCGIERRTEEEDGLMCRFSCEEEQFLVGASPLKLAIHERRLDVAKALLVAGADPNAMDSTGRNSLMYAILTPNLEAIETLISYGADIDAADKNGNAAIHYAMGRGTNLIELLERAGANLDAGDNEGCTPLHDAASNIYVGIIKALLKLGANQAAVDYDGRTPLHCAAANYHYYVSVGIMETFRYNVAAFEANLTAVDKNGRTPIQVLESRSRASSIDDRKVRALLTPK